MPLLTTLVRDAVRHPARLAALVAKRALEIPKRGLPKWKPDPPDDFDARHGVETASAGLVVVTDSPNRVYGTRYETAPEATTRWCIEHAGLTDATFIDFGCGKGRAVIVASSYAFRSVIGVEYDHDLVMIARRNVAICSAAVDVIEADAATWPLPSGPLLAYFNNPFGPPVHTVVLERLTTHKAAVVIAHVGPGNETVRAFGLEQFASLREEAAHLYRP
jgi:SAM-dependent methyltransferase